jgi:hypothetical protein
MDHAITKAWIEYEGRVYYTTETSSKTPDLGAVFRLISAIYERFAFQSFRVLRQRIFTTKSCNPTDRALIRLGAKRCTYDAAWPETGREFVDLNDTQLHDPISLRLENETGRQLTSTEAKIICRDLADNVPLLPERFISSRPISAVLVDHEHRLLLAAVNTNAINRVRHAEINLLLHYLKIHNAALPIGATLYTSLSPCAMCARMLAELSEDGEHLQIVFLESDRKKT